MNPNGVVAWLSGLLFALGLGIGGMTQPAKVVAFLDIFGDWDPSLAFVMGGGVLVYFVAYRLVLRRSAPIFAARFLVPTRNDIDLRLVAGAALFGLGWGLGGFCPGPGLTAMMSGAKAPLIFVASMVVGMVGYHAVQGWLQRQPRGDASHTTP